MSESLRKKFGYTQTVMDHFKNPRNIGAMTDADVTSKVGSVACGDLIKLYLKFDKDQIKDIKFESYGCAANIATSSMMTEMVKSMVASSRIPPVRAAAARTKENSPI